MSAVRLQGFAASADPEDAGKEIEHDDGASAAAKARAYIGQVLAVLAKFHADAREGTEGMSNEEIDATLVEGVHAAQKALGYIDCIEHARREEQQRAAAARLS